MLNNSSSQKQITAKEFKRETEKERIKLKKEFELSLIDWKNKKNKEYFIDFLTIKVIRSDYFSYHNSAIDIYHEAGDFLKKIKNLPYHIRGKHTTEMDDDNDCNFKYIYYVHQETFPKNIATVKMKNKLMVMLKPEKEHYARPIDCKLMELFLDETLSFSALQKLVYSNCKI